MGKYDDLVGRGETLIKGGPPSGTFGKIEAKIRASGGADDPAAVAAKVYREKYGAETLARRSAAARKKKKKKDEKPMQKSFGELVSHGEQLLKGGSTLQKGLYGGRVTEWADEFYGTPLYADALQCLKDRANCEKEMDAVRASQKDWRELEEMPKTEREATRKKQAQEMQSHYKRREKIGKKMLELEEKLLDHKIEEAKPASGKSMSKSMDSKPTTELPPEVQVPPEQSETDKQVEKFMDQNDIMSEGLPFGLRSTPSGNEPMSKGDDAPGNLMNPPQGAAYSSFDLDAYGVGDLNQPDGNGGLDEDKEPGQKYKEPEDIITTLIPNSPMVHGSSR